MADNYLEKKMDEYRRGLLSAPARRKTTPSGYARGCASFLPFPVGVKILMLTDSASETELKALVDAGCRVAFTGNDRKEGKSIAQSCGAQFHPVFAGDEDAVRRSMDLIKTRWRGNVEIIVSHGYAFPDDFDGFKISIGEDMGGNLTIAEDPDPAMLLWAILPQTRKYFT